MKRLPVVTDYQVCADCGGNCCKAMPGGVFPADVWGVDGPDWQRVRAMLESGNYAVDWWEGDPEQYYMRPATVNGGRVLDGSWGGACVLLTDDGCPLDEDERPTGCRILAPHPDGGSCTVPDSDRSDKEMAKDAWAPWSEALYALALGIEDSRDEQSPNAFDPFWELGVR